MNSKEAKKLTRAELLELLIEQTEENQRLTQKITRLEETLAQRLLVMERSGSIAEAAMQLTGIFQSAQEAADLYVNAAKKFAKDVETAAYEEAANILAKAQQARKNTD